MSLKIYANVSESDNPLNLSGTDWLEIDTVNDSLIFTDGSDTVKDGEPIPSDSQLNSAAPVLDGSQQTIEKYLIADASANELKEIDNMGAGNYRYVLAFDFDDETVSEPVLEVWDDTDMDSIDNTVLGAGTAALSWFAGITTTDALPGAAWTGKRLAGSADGNFLWLNDESGALSTAKTLYAQLKLVIPATQQNSAMESPVIAVKYASI
jgi:hypothetical protein